MGVAETPLHIRRFGDSDLAIQAALNGLGVTLIWHSLVMNDLKAGRLKRVLNLQHTDRFHLSTGDAQKQDDAEQGGCVQGLVVRTGGQSAQGEAGQEDRLVQGRDEVEYFSVALVWRYEKQKPGDAGLLFWEVFPFNSFPMQTPLIPQISTTALLQDTRCVLADT